MHFLSSILFYAAAPPSVRSSCKWNCSWINVRQCVIRAQKSMRTAYASRQGVGRGAQRQEEATGILRSKYHRPLISTSDAVPRTPTHTLRLYLNAFIFPVCTHRHTQYVLRTLSSASHHPRSDPVGLNTFTCTLYMCTLTQISPVNKFVAGEWNWTRTSSAHLFPTLTYITAYFISATMMTTTATTTNTTS